jgi:hypothetical protein
LIPVLEKVNPSNNYVQGIIIIFFCCWFYFP